MSYKNLQFYDKLGNNTTPTLNEEGVFEFSIALEKTSAGLFSTQHLFILEEILFQDNTIKKSKPTQVFLPNLIKVLEYLNKAGEAVEISSLRQFFNFNSNDDEYYVSNFLNSNSNYINKYFFGDKTFYSILPEGRVYLESWHSNYNLYNSANYNLTQGYVRPRAECNSSSGEDVYLTFNWKNFDNDNEMFLFFIDNADETKYKGESAFDSKKTFPAIVPAYQLDLLPSETNPYWKVWSEPYKFDKVSHSENGTKSADSYFNNDKNSFRILKDSTAHNNEPFQINIALNSKTEGFYERTLEINITHQFVNDQGLVDFFHMKLARINFFGEVVGEDERFKNILDNFGREVKESDVFVFRDSDVSEVLPNYIELNTKRKELLMAGEEIYPYIGSYKGFVNALRFFGYSDLRLKEYFINVQMSDFNNKKLYYSALEVPFEVNLPEPNSSKDYNKTVFGQIADSSIMKKTSRFGLYYDINTWSGNYDDMGFPIMVDSYAFTNEEILIKLYGLKTILEDRFLPHNVRIIDITGEGLYFAKFKINTWQDLNKIIGLQLNHSPDFEAFPKEGYVKNLQKLLNIFKKELNIIDNIEKLDLNTIISDVIDRSLTEFMSNIEDNFEFDSDVTLNDIKRFYGDYSSLKNAIFDHLRNSPCVDYIDNIVFKQNILSSDKKLLKEQLIESTSYSLNLYGLPVIIKLKPYDVTWDDLTVPWEALSLNSDLEGKIYSSEDVDYIFTWENIGYFGFQNINWFITHENNEYCHREAGLIKDKKEILVFLGKEGNYDVSCTVQDLTNFPNMKGKKKYIKVNYPDVNFAAISRFVNTFEVWEDFNTVSWDEIQGSWETPNYCSSETTWDDCQLSWDDLDYSNYLNQTLVKDVKHSSVVDYSESLNEITIKGREFFDDYNKFSDSRIKNHFVLERDSATVPTASNISVFDFSKNTVIAKGNHDIKLGEKINCYIDVNITKFARIKNKIILPTDYYDLFLPNSYIKILDLKTNRHFYFKITDTSVDYNLNKTEITIEDSILFSEVVFANIEIKSYSFIFKVTAVNYNTINDLTQLTVEDNNSKIRTMKSVLTALYNTINLSEHISFECFSGDSVLPVVDLKDDLIEFKLEYGIHSGYFVFEAQDVKLVNKNSVVSVDKNVCQITTSFDVQWCEFDIDYARKFSNLITPNIGELNRPWESMNHLTWEMLEFSGNSHAGFKLSNIGESGFITMNSETINWNFNYNGIILAEDSRLIKVFDLFRNSELKTFNNFNYHLIDNKFIIAVNKNQDVDKIFTIITDNTTVCNKDTFPRLNSGLWENNTVHDNNNKALWHPVIRELNLDINDTYNSVLEGSFNWGDTFISYKDMTIPVNSPVIISVDNSNIFQDLSDKIIEWEIIEETQSKQIIKTQNPFVIFNFVDEGIYSVILRIKTKQNKTKEYYKHNWITVK